MKSALRTLEEGVRIAKSDLERDGVIQRFEYAFELLWKTLKLYLNYEGIECFSPRSCIKEAFRRGLIEDVELLLEMLEDRNRTSHIYEEKIAEEIFEKIRDIYLPFLKVTIQKLEKEIIQ